MIRARSGISDEQSRKNVAGAKPLLVFLGEGMARRRQHRQTESQAGKDFDIPDSEQTSSHGCPNESTEVTVIIPAAAARVKQHDRIETNAAGMMTVTSVDRWGQPWNSSAHYPECQNPFQPGFLSGDAAGVEPCLHPGRQQRLCTGDVFRLCSSEIPDRARDSSPACTGKRPA